MAEKIKNRRLRLVEAEVVDTAEVELIDLLSSSSKAEKAILELCDKCLAFKNSKVKEMALQLKSRAAALTQALSNLEITGDVSDVGGDELGGNDTSNLQGTDSQNLNAEGQKQPLDMPEAAPVFESAKAKYLKRKQLKETALEFEAAVPGEVANDKTGQKELDKEEKVISDNTYDKPSIAEEGVGDKVVIDLTGPFEQLIQGLDPNEFQTFKSSVVSNLEGAIDSIEKKKDPTVADQFTKSIEALSASQTVDDFDIGMEQIYDFADENNILVETIKRK